MDVRVDIPETVIADWAASVLQFWFNDVGETGWWTHDPVLDKACADRFAALWDQMRRRPAVRFHDRADEALAAVILFDQLPRNMFRGTPRAFATDPLARKVARGAIAQGFDVQIGGAGRLFFYMPFQHSEKMEDQTLSVSLFEATGDHNSIKFAHRHCATIARFGRFPHRNPILGRAMRAGEADAAKEGAGW